MKRAMFMTVVVLGLAVCCLAAEAPLNKQVTVDYRNLPVADVLKDLEGKTGLRIACAPDLGQNADHVNYAANDQEAGRVLTRILRPRGLNIRPSGDGSVSVFKLDKYDQFKVKREEVYEFAEKPRITRDGDRVTIAFETKSFCDVTIALENADGRIVRHLASGVLGDNAPEPFLWNSKKQVVVWDGKNEKGEYVDDKDNVTVRVSLGLKPRYEKNLYWEPKRRISGVSVAPYPTGLLVATAPEGVYVYDSNGIDHLRLFDHEGNYVRTVYPFPADKLKAVKGLQWKDYPQGYSRPMKYGLHQTTFLLGGVPAPVWGPPRATPSAFSMAVCGDRIALVKKALTRLSTDGSSWGGAGLLGPRTAMPLSRDPNLRPLPYAETNCSPWSAAFSPDGKKVYLAGYFLNASYTYGGSLSGLQWLSGVACMDFEGDAPARPFVGNLEPKVAVNSGVACDGKGNVYVADYLNNRIDVYDPQGKLLKTISAKRPANIQIHPRTGEIFVFSWPLYSREVAHLMKPPPPELGGKDGWGSVPFTLTVLGPMADPKPAASYSLPDFHPRCSGYDSTNPGGLQVRVAVDFWTDPFTVWLTGDTPLGEINIHAVGRPWEQCGIVMLQPKDGKLVETRNFAKETVRSLGRAWADFAGSQRLFVNPVTEKLYVAEYGWAGSKGSHCMRCVELAEVDPSSGAVRIINLPREAEDMAFDLDGHIYLRPSGDGGVPNWIIRYDPRNWREIPWDYGEERRGFLSVLPLPADGTVNNRQGGFWVSPKGHIAVACSKLVGSVEITSSQPKSEHYKNPQYGTPYQPRLFPGRAGGPVEGNCLHVWDKHGKVVYEDAVPGKPQTHGVKMDASDNLYMLACPAQRIEGTDYLNYLTGTLIKVKPGKNRFLTAAGAIPLSKEQCPKRPVDLYGQWGCALWVEGAEWMYGGVGMTVFKGNGHCDCWATSQFDLDLFGRTFAPEPDQFSVAVLDTNGNLVTRVGRYGNVDDGVPLDPKGAPPHARSIGGDEVALMHACHVATLSDRFLYIGDLGNARIAKVRLGYHTEEKVALRDVPDRGR